MSRVRALLVAVLVGVMVTGSPAVRAFADIDDASGTNVEDGNNSGSTRQGGRSGSGDAVGGQVTGVVANGRTSVDARNLSRDSSVESGEASASNSSRSFVGLASSADDINVGAADLSFITAGDNANLQDGNNRQTVNQTTNATTGDGVAGEVIGVVTAPGGSASVVAANTTTDSDVLTGEADANNDSAAFVGLANASETVAVAAADITNVTAPDETNLQEGNNRQSLNQSATSSTGDGVAGQVIGAVSAGRTSVDARNASDGVSVDTGDATSNNDSAAVVGLALSEHEDILVGPSDLDDIDITSEEANVQEGNNRQSARQTAVATTGDGVAGEVIGAVTSAGGSASIVAANASRTSDVTTGEAESTNASDSFVGLVLPSDSVTVGTADISNLAVEDEANIQEGNNRQSLGQSTTSSSGDGVAGQVIGAVSAGATSIDATNASDGVSVDTGDATTTNDSAAIVGLALSDGDNIVVAADITNVFVDDEASVQEGNNSQSVRQSAAATTGDGVAGEVIGAVTSAGGTASIVAANTSRDSAVSTGDGDAVNDSSALVGVANAEDDILIAAAADVASVTATDEANVQEGNNRQTLAQSARASTGDGVAGQVIGAVSAGATSIDARNLSDDVAVDTGDADASNDSSAFIGLAMTIDRGGVDVAASDIRDIVVDDGDDDVNVQDGNNRQSLTQNASAVTGDGVGGEVIGVVTSAGGSASVVAANTSRRVDASSGDADSANSSEALVGHAVASTVTVAAADITNVRVATDANVQDGNNTQRLAQTATASTGDGIAGQVIGVVSAGATSVDAANLSEDSSVESGDADASNSSSAFVGLVISNNGVEVAAGDVSGVDPGDQANIQDGNNRQTLAQAADASSGDAIAGQVLAGVTAGVITGAGGSVSLVVANTSSGIDSSTGDADFANAGAAFIGLAIGPTTTVVP